MIQAKINTDFFLLGFNPNLFTHQFYHAAKQNACKGGREQRQETSSRELHLSVAVLALPTKAPRKSVSEKLYILD